MDFCFAQTVTIRSKIVVSKANAVDFNLPLCNIKQKTQTIVKLPFCFLVEITAPFVPTGSSQPGNCVEGEYPGYSFFFRLRKSGAIIFGT